jgi:hypothetical protein
MLRRLLRSVFGRSSSCAIARQTRNRTVGARNADDARYAPDVAGDRRLGRLEPDLQHHARQRLRGHRPAQCQDSASAGRR